MNYYETESLSNPPSTFPELKYFNFNTDPTNKIYKMIRDLLKILKLDKEKIDTSKWNPLSELIKDGDIYLIKPNFVKHFHPVGSRGILATITQNQKV